MKDSYFIFIDQEGNVVLVSVEDFANSKCCEIVNSENSIKFQKTTSTKRNKIISEYMKAKGKIKDGTDFMAKVEIHL